MAGLEFVTPTVVGEDLPSRRGGRKNVPGAAVRMLQQNRGKWVLVGKSSHGGALTTLQAAVRHAGLEGAEVTSRRQPDQSFAFFVRLPEVPAKGYRS